MAKKRIKHDEPRPEIGVAGIRLELSGGRIKVMHTECGSLLAEGAVHRGAWDAIWSLLDTLGVRRIA